MAPADLGREQALVRRQSAKAIALTALVCTASVLWPQALVTGADGLASRLALGVHTTLPHLLCVLVGLRMVSSGRYRSQADIGGAAAGPPSAALAVKAAFLQNTLEQAFVAFGSHLLLASIADGRWLGLLTASAVLFPVGRLLFYRGYAGGAGSRAFGMALTALPPIVCLGTAVVIGCVRLFGG